MGARLDHPPACTTCETPADGAPVSRWARLRAGCTPCMVLQAGIVAVLGLAGLIELIT